MKKISCLFLSLVLVVSCLLPTTAFAVISETEGPLLTGGNTITMYAKHYSSRVDANGYMGGAYTEVGEDAYILNGNIAYNFECEADMDVEFTMYYALHSSSELYNSNIIAFLNPDKIIEEYTSDMTADTDYPSASKAVLNNFSIKGKYIDIPSDAVLSEVNWHTHKFTARAKKGKNTLWFPSYTLMDNSTGSWKMAYPVGDDASNNRFIMYKLDAKSKYDSTTYAYELADKPSYVSQDIDPEHKYMFAQGFMGDDEKGFTNNPYSSYGSHITFPFYVPKDGKYRLKVYYSAFNSSYLGGKMYIDGDVSVLNNSKITDTSKANLQDGNTNGTVRNDFITANTQTIKNFTWDYTGNLAGKSNTAPYFSMKTFDIESLASGMHTITFIYEGDTSAGQYFTYPNYMVVFNRVEFVPADEADDYEVNSYVVDKVDDTHFDYVATLTDAKTKTPDFVAEIVNNSDESLVLTPIFACYDADNKLISSKYADSEITVEAVANKTVRNTIPFDWTGVDSATKTVKMMLWSNSEFAPISLPVSIAD